MVLRILFRSQNHFSFSSDARKANIVFVMVNENHTGCILRVIEWLYGRLVGRDYNLECQYIALIVYSGIDCVLLPEFFFRRFFCWALITKKHLLISC